MDLSLLLALTAIALPVLLHLLTGARKPRPGAAKLPPGSLGLPVIGQSLSLLGAMRANTAERWIQDRVDRYGPVSKLSLFGAPTVLLTGPAANKFVFFSGALATKHVGNKPSSCVCAAGRVRVLCAASRECVEPSGPWRVACVRARASCACVCTQSSIVSAIEAVVVRAIRRLESGGGDSRQLRGE